MSRFRIATAFIIGILIATLAPTVAGATNDRDAHRSAPSDVEFGRCLELATGTTVALSELEERVPESVRVLSLTDQGVVFPGSDNLGILITRSLECDSISVTRDGRTKTQYDRHTAHVGTPIDTSNLPNSPFSTDGGNGAAFNNYVFGYYTDSSIYLDAMRRAGVESIAVAQIDIQDEVVGECVLDRQVTVQPHTAPSNDYGFTASGIVPDASCEAPVVPFIGNWWSVSGGQAAVLSNNIPGQSAVFVDTAETVITLEPGRRSQLSDVFAGSNATADAFGFIGAIPSSEMIISEVGGVGGF